MRAASCLVGRKYISSLWSKTPLSHIAYDAHNLEQAEVPATQIELASGNTVHFVGRPRQTT
jgi:hypothetical protein